jgi:hypothetical protein
MTTGVIKNWAKFQHYKDRSPPWIKLEKRLLDDYEFASLPIASKALAPLLWLLASEEIGGEVRLDTEWLSFRLRWALSDIESGLTPLIEKGFVIVASDVLAERLQAAVPEAEAEAEAEAECSASASSADILLDAYHSILPKCQRIAVLNPKRMRRLRDAEKLARQVCKSQGWLYEPAEFWPAYFDHCATDPWMRGEVANPKNSKWKQNLDVLLKEDRFAEIMDVAIANMQEVAA